jgi:CRISPR-associated protein Cas1
VIAVESVQFTSQALGALLRANIPVSLLGWNGRFLGAFQPATIAHGRARLRQYERTRDPSFALSLAIRIVTSKLYNQRRILQRLLAGHKRHNSGPEPDLWTEKVQADLGWLDQLFAHISRSASLDELRGHEGAATARYFQAWAFFLPHEFPFERRSRRPPLNPVNACLSFGSTLLYQETSAFLLAHGLDPALGLLHTTEDGRWSLALDLIEPFRPALVEALALDLFAHRILDTSHFESREGGTYLNEEGRKRFFLQYERRMERQFMSEAVGHRTTLRQQLEHQAIQFKSALDEPGRFDPFLVN